MRFLMIKPRIIGWIAAIGAIIHFVPGLSAAIFYGDRAWHSGLSYAIDITSALGMFLLAVALALWAISLWQKNVPSQLSYIFLSISLSGYLISCLGSEIYARLIVANESMKQSILETFYYALTQPLGTLLLMIPFFILGWLASLVSNARSLLKGIMFYCLSFLILGYLYLWGYIESQEYMKLQKWTAATLSVGLLPFKSIVVLAPLYFIATRFKSNNTSST